MLKTMRKILFERRDHRSRGSAVGARDQTNSEYEAKWRFIAKEWGGRVKEWKIAKWKHQD